MMDQIFADKDEFKRRMIICEGCDKRSMLNICKECGCIVMTKAKLQGSSCPLGKWNKQQDKENKEE